MTAKAAFKTKFHARVIDVPGSINRALTVANTHGLVKVKRSKLLGISTFKSTGLAVAFNGGGDEPKNSQVYRDAFELSSALVQAGGVILNGGRNTGIMQATGEAAGTMCLGVNFAEQIQKNTAHHFGKRLVVHPLTRLALLTWCPPVVVVYEGTLGTFHELVNALVAIKNQSLYGITSPQLFVSKFWQHALSGLVKSRVIPGSYLDKIVFFDNRQTVLKQLLR